MAVVEMESWDDEFEGNFQSLAAHSVGTARTALSSRMSVTSESLAGGDDDWNLVLQGDDESATSKALASAKAAGIPLPSNVPHSALLGGTIKRLGKENPKLRLDDDWAGDIEIPEGRPLHLKLPPPPLSTATGEEYDDFDELEGSLGIRSAGARRDVRGRSSSTPAMSPSIGSVTAESEDNDFRGLELPEGPVDFDAMLKKRRAADAELSDLSQPSPALEQPATLNVHKKSRLLANDSEDYLADFDLGPGAVFDSHVRNVNKNIRFKNGKQPTPSHRPATTLVFHEKVTDKPMHTRSHIPRPISGARPPMSRLEPVLESGASRVMRDRRQPATTTTSQLLKSKRSLPVLRGQHIQTPVHKPSVPFLPAGVTSAQSQHVTMRQMPYHLRRESDPNRFGAQSPPLRTHSRLSNTNAPETPSRGSRQRHDVAPSALAREAAAKRTLTKPARQRNYGDGSELEIFDDLPTSMTKEIKYMKQPVGRGPPKAELRHTHSRSEMRDPVRRILPDRMATPSGPRTPAATPRPFYEAQSHTPSYLRDTAASRIARETRLGPGPNPRPRSEGPLMPLSTNWKAHVAARSPHTSPSAQRHRPRTKQPQLIKGIGAHVAKTEKGMVYNPHTLRWEGNENTLEQFDAQLPLETPTPTTTGPASSYMDRHIPLSASPPRPALIAPMSNAATAGIQVNGGMVFDPRQMKWLKLKGGRDASGPLSPSVTDNEEEDAFAGIEDLKDDLAPGHPSLGVGLASPVSLTATGVGEVHEEFDLGPRFIEMQQTEEASWMRRCAAWFPANGGQWSDDGRWRWAIRDIARHEAIVAMEL